MLEWNDENSSPFGGFIKCFLENTILKSLIKTKPIAQALILFLLAVSKSIAI